MRAEEVIFEARGVTAREPGETYVSDTDPSDVLTIQSIDVFPSDKPNYESLEELESVLSQVIPADSDIVDDNGKNAGTKAAIVATVLDKNDNTQYWVRYIKSVPATGVHSLWRTLKGYKYGKGAKDESLPIKPSDLITDETYRSSEEVANAVLSNLDTQLANTGHESLELVMQQAIKQARAGQSEYIENARNYQNVLAKYGGEYLGPLALVDATSSVTGDTVGMLQHFNLDTLAGSQIMFPQDIAMELIDSVIRTPDGQEIQISSKISKSGGAASSLSGVAKQIPDSAREQYPTATKIIDLLATETAVNGPIKVALQLGIIDQNDVVALGTMDKSTRNVNDLQSKNLRKMVNAQNVQPGTTSREDYRVFFHALTAIANAVVAVLNNNSEFASAILAALNNNQYVQLITRTSVKGDSAALNYYTKFPAVFEGQPVLFNKSYFATGQKGRLGFKLK